MSQNRSRNRMIKNNTSLFSLKNPRLPPMLLTPSFHITVPVYSS
ncbi:hypothetical protein Cst_c14850 [Thermoclostridium stercorarium subsp. stercorarium DSM 8532]|uniref:Uncharacterized protein n=1 Tax=Thermoclostridium stercorarium (strain ATCC 35414 / DSM 8532 / NCIMB 11754) TaxID=1121335 RepID=L7VP69_THES1|nr:hypothetical protein Cst_c14850 [Thermoclostridium stercorarium subsp. stercorarium DSM 8532]